MAKYTSKDFQRIVKELDPSAEFICVERTKGENNRRTFLYLEYAGQVWKSRLENIRCKHKPWFNLRNSFPVLYKFYNSSGELIYLGKSTRFGKRLQEHKSKNNSWWYDEVTTIEVAYPENEADMHILEPYLISILKPKHNREFSEDCTTSFKLPEPKFYSAESFAF